MANKWIEHVKKFSKDNNKSYGCSISDPACKNSYKPVVKKTSKEIAEEKKKKREERNKFYYDQFKYDMIDRIKKMKEDNEKPLLKMKFNTLNKAIRDDIKENYTKYYNKLFMAGGAS